MQPHPKPPAVQAPNAQPAAPLPSPPPPPEPPLPPPASVSYVGEGSWSVTLPANAAWFNTAIPIAPGYQLWAEPAEPTADCQFQLMVADQVYSSEVVSEKDTPDTQRILHLFPWSEMPADVPIWVESVKLRLAPSCRRESLTLDIESTSLIEPDDPLLRLEELSERRQRVLASHAAARYLQQLFERKGEKN
jgi:hypothetical protein